MKAARVRPEATSAVVEEIEDPTLRPGSVIVRIEAAFASHFAAKTVDGSGGYLTPPRPFTPGSDAIGSVESLAHGVSGLSVGDRVIATATTSRGIRRVPGNVSLSATSHSARRPCHSCRLGRTAPMRRRCASRRNASIRFGPEPPQPASVLCRLGWLGSKRPVMAALRRATGT